MPLAAHRLEVRRSPAGLQWWRGHCGTCASCVSGLEAWCLSFRTPADELTDDPSAGWKGRALYANYGTHFVWHIEGGKGTKGKIAKFQIRPNPLAR